MGFLTLEYNGIRIMQLFSPALYKVKLISIQGDDIGNLDKIEKLIDHFEKSLAISLKNGCL